MTYHTIRALVPRRLLRAFQLTMGLARLSSKAPKHGRNVRPDSSDRLGPLGKHKQAPDTVKRVGTLPAIFNLLLRDRISAPHHAD